MVVCSRCKDVSVEATFYLRFDMDPRKKRRGGENDDRPPHAFSPAINQCRENQYLCADCANEIAHFVVNGPRKAAGLTI